MESFIYKKNINPQIYKWCINKHPFINSQIILGLVHLLVIQPIALIMKIFGYDPLRLKKSNKLSYKESKEFNKVDLKRIF